MAKHIFDKYFRKHGHYPRLIFDNGIQTLTVEFCPGYVRMRTSHPFSGEIYITRSTFLQVLRRSVPLARRWKKFPDFDVPQQVLEAHQQEMILLQEQRHQKRHRQIQTPDPTATRKKHARYLRAKARGQKRASE